MNNKKITRILALIMAAALALSMTGCDKDKDKKGSTSEVADESYEDADDYDYSDEYADDDYEDADDSDTSDTGDTDCEMDNIGITFHFPAQYINTVGSVELADADMTGFGEIFFCVANYIGLSRDEYSDEYVSERAEEAYGDLNLPIFTIVAITGERGAEDIIRSAGDFMEEGVTADDFSPVGSADGVNFFEYKKNDTSNYKNLEGDFKTEYDALVSLKDGVISGATYKRPDDAVDPDPNSAANAEVDKISFTTTDFDGNTITSEEIFSQHEITMVNVWATWCGWCTGELAELQQINQRLAEKDCAIVGLCGDARDDENSWGLAHGLLQENGVTYLNICPYDGWNDDFDMNNGWPTSFFVNREGVMISEPVCGAKVDRYESIIDALLNGGASPRLQKTNSYTNSDNVYRVRVVDDALQPIEGVMVQFCSDENCNMGVTGSDGTTTFDNPPGNYEVHVKKLPAGYEENTTTYTTEAQYSDMVIVVERAD